MRPARNASATTSARADVEGGCDLLQEVLDRVRAQIDERADLLVGEAAGEPPSWVAAMLGHASPEMLCSVYARFIPNRTRRDGSALVSRMDVRETRAESNEG